MHQKDISGRRVIAAPLLSAILCTALLMPLTACSPGGGDTATKAPASPEAPSSKVPDAKTYRAENWTAWGGPSGDFVVESAGPLAESWPTEGPPVLWQRSLGGGYASILYRDGTLHTSYRDGNEEVVIALDAATGVTRWERRDAAPLWPDMYKGFGLGPNATPLLVGECLLAIGIGGHLRALNPDDGALVWERDLPAEWGRLERIEEYGYSASPLAYQGTAIVQVGGDGAAIVALDPADGAVRWTSEPGGISYAQPMITSLLGRDQYLYFEPEGLVALDPSTGQILWKHVIEFNNGNHLTPAVRTGDEHLWIGSQFDSGGGRLLQLAEEGGAIRVQEQWFDPALSASHWTLIPRGDFIYGSLGGNDSSYIGALRWRTGEVAWKDQRFHKAQALWADDKFLFLDEAGHLVLSRATPEGFEVLGQVQIAEPEAWTLPILVGTRLFLRDQKKILVLDLG